MKQFPRRKLIAILSVLLAVCVLLLVVPIIYNLYGRRVMASEGAGAARHPGTPYLKGGAPVVIDRGRDRACLLLHGFMGTPADFGALPQALDAAGWDVHAPLLPGHGTSPGDLEAVSAPDYAATCAQELQNLRRAHAQVAIIGFSLGGALAVLTAAEHGADALVLVNPFFRVTHKVYYVLPPRTWHTLAHGLVDVAVRPADIVHVKKPGAAGNVVHYRAIPSAALGPLFEVADRAYDTALPDVPTLAVICDGDSTADPAASRRFFDRQTVKLKRLITCSRSDHVVFWDYDAEAAAAKIVEFLDGLERP
jgi:carboxylesterase